MSQPMQKGFNSDISVRGRPVHVQTEDWGPANPFLVSRVFVGGAVLRTLKTPYADALRSGPVNETEAIRLALKRQHQRVLDELTSGQLSIGV
jgi:hypothetical protein